VTKIPGIVFSGLNALALTNSNALLSMDQFKDYMNLIYERNPDAIDNVAESTTGYEFIDGIPK